MNKQQLEELKQLASAAEIKHKFYYINEKGECPYGDWINYANAANPETILNLINTIYKLGETVEHIAKIDISSQTPDLLWLIDWRNTTKQLAQRCLKEVDWIK